MQGVFCPECGREVPDGAPDSLCPACLLRGVLEPEPPPTLEETSGGAGQRFGPYTTLRVLGRGGMGIVYLARQDQPFRREVALKVIHPGLELTQVISRFEAERQALALMDHPSIARIYDAGATSGQPYFAMEYFAGSPVTEYCDSNRLGIRERLELFREICLAVHHAHQKGIIHRDIKPSNVLAATLDGKPALKVIDFGIAKATHQRLTEQTLFTQHGVLFGTVAYMSPEQAELGALEVDAAADIYSLGVLLYELIAGALPLDVESRRSSGYFEMLRVIREEDPPPPDQRIAALGPPAEEVAHRRGTDARSLYRLVQGDLAWITMRTLEKDRSRRYASASELAAEIVRYLNDDPVHAGPPSPAYRLKKFVRKHRGGVAAAAALLACLIAGLAVSSTLYVAEQRQRDIAERQGYLANLTSAEAQLNASDYSSARELLFQCPPRLRGWEWNLLYALTDTSARTLQASGENYAAHPPDGQIAFGPGGRSLHMRMAHSIHSWETASWKPGPAQGLFGEILGMAPDGSIIATRVPGETDARVLILELPSRKALATLDGEPAEAAAFSPDARLAAIASRDGRLQVWHIPSGSRRFSAPAERGPEARPRLSFSPDGRLLACGRAGTVRVFEAATGRLAASSTGPETVYGLAFRPDGKRLAIVDQANRIRVWNLANPREPERVWMETDACFAVAYSPGGDRLVTAARHGAVRLWNAETGAPLGTLSGLPAHKAAAVAFSPDERLVLAAANGGGLRIWELDNHGGGSVLRSGVRDLAASPDLTRVADTSGSQTVLRDGATGRVLHRIPAGAQAVAVSGEGKKIALGDSNGVVRIVEADTGTQTAVWTAHDTGIHALAFSPGERLLVTIAGGKTAKLWDPVTGANQGTISAPEVINAAAFSPHAQYLATGAGATGHPVPGGAAALWEVSSGRLARVLEPEWDWGECVRSLAFSPDGQMIAAGQCYTGTVRLCQTSTGRLVADLKGHLGEVLSLAFSPDGRLLVSGSQDGTVRLWDVSSRKPLFVLRRPSSPVEDLAFGSAGTRLFSRYLDGSVRIWSTDTAYPSRTVELLSGLFRKFALWSDVRHFLRNDTQLDAALREEAFRTCAHRPDADAPFIDLVFRPLFQARAAASDPGTLLRRCEDYYQQLSMAPEAAGFLGGARYRNGLYDEAIKILKPVSAVSHQDPTADLFLAMALARTGRSSEARMHWSRVRPQLARLNPLILVLIEPALREAEALVSDTK